MLFFNGNWVVSSVGRASALHAECRQFETVTTHQVLRKTPIMVLEWFAKPSVALKRLRGSSPRSSANCFLKEEIYETRSKL